MPPSTPSWAPGRISIAAAGKATDDGFTSYTAQVGTPPRTRSGDHGAAATRSR